MASIYSQRDAGDAGAAVFRALVAEHRRAISGGGAPASAASASSAAAAAAPLPPLPPLRARPLTVVVRKRPLSEAEARAGRYDVLAVEAARDDFAAAAAGGAAGAARGAAGAAGAAERVYVLEPRTRYDLERVVERHAFSFDAAFCERRATGELYARVLRPLVLGLDRGAQVTAFAYGQTGSGKTHTMGGLTAAVVEDAMALVASPQGRARGLVLCVSFFEVYCAKVLDLLNGRAALALREDGDGTVQVVGLVEHATRDARVVAALLEAGLACRATGQTRVNADSSRSHAVLQLLLREAPPQGQGQGQHVRGHGGGAAAGAGAARLVGKVSLVDLAGSEQACESAPPDAQVRGEAKREQQQQQQ
jgi:hypothetical protein